MTYLLSFSKSPLLAVLPFFFPPFNLMLSALNNFKTAASIITAVKRALQGDIYVLLLRICVTLWS